MSIGFKNMDQVLRRMEVIGNAQRSALKIQNRKQRDEVRRPKTIKSPLKLTVVPSWSDEQTKEEFMIAFNECRQENTIKVLKESNCSWSPIHD